MVMHVTVWREQDWIWRLAAISGIVLLLAGLLGVGLCLDGFPGTAPCSDDGVFEMDSNAWDDTLFCAELCLLLALLWLPMLKWPVGSLLWAAAIAVPGLYVGLILAVPDNVTQAVGLHFFLERFLIAGILASQIWVVWEGFDTAFRGPGFPAADGSGPKLPPTERTGWRRAVHARWRLLAALGGGVAVGSYGVIAWHFGCKALAHSELDGALANYGALLGVLLLAAAMALICRSLVTTGRGWLWWLPMWTMPILGYLFVPVCCGPEDVFEHWHPVAVAALTLSVVLFCVAQVWVALKAREARSQGVGRDAL